VIYSSVVFLYYFLPVVLVVYFLLPRINHKNIFLFIASIVFYAWGEGKLIVLLLAVGISTWGFSHLIITTKHKKLFAYTGVVILIMILVYYKYVLYLISINTDTGDGFFSNVKYVMPIGVSFFTFQGVSYIIDVYRQPQNHERNIFYVLLYISMFPQLISGPLVRYNVISEQLKSRHFEFDVFTEGIKRFIKGLAKKLLLANPLGLLVNEIMLTEIHFLGPLAAWIGIIAFTLQLFFDFSAYTDMAIGVGKMLGFELPENFNYPYISRSVTEFWRRWHITLSGWLRDYVFIPLSLSLRHFNKAGVFFSLFITFIICGMWHSAGWNFFIWGAIHGFFLGMEQLFLSKYLSKLKMWSLIYTLLVITSSFVFVTARDLSHAISYLNVMYSFPSETSLGIEAFLGKQHLFLMGIGIIFCLPIEKLKIFSKKHKALEVGELLFLIVLLLFSVMALTSETYNPFLYFRF